VVKRVFEIELDIPDDFVSEYGQFYTLTPRTVINNGDLVWTIYCDRRKPEPQWVKAEAKDEGKKARFRDDESEEWITGKLLHYDHGTKQPWLGLVRNDVDVVIEARWFNCCEVPL
jgi:hypothetical protein